MGCCSSSEDEEDRRPVLGDTSAPVQVSVSSGVPHEAVARLQKSFDEAEAEESARKAALLLKKEQQDRATRDALLAPPKKAKASAPAAQVTNQVAPLPPVSSPSASVAAPKAPTSLSIAPDTFDLANTPIASPPPLASSTVSVASAPVSDETLIAMAQRQITEEKQKEQNLKQAESILDQVEQEAHSEIIRRSETRAQNRLSKAEEILAETEGLQHEASLKKQQRRSVVLMQRAEDILAETERESPPPRSSPSASSLLSVDHPSTSPVVPKQPEHAPSSAVAPTATAPVSEPALISTPAPASPAAQQVTAVPAAQPAPVATVSPVAQDVAPAPAASAPVAPVSPVAQDVTPMPAAAESAPVAAVSPRDDSAQPMPTSSPAELTNTHSTAASPALPADYDPEKYPKGRVTWDYAAHSENELSLKAGDILRIWEDKGEDWSLGELNGRSGYFPGNYVQRIRVTKRVSLKRMASNKILELQAKTGLLDNEKPEKDGETF